MNLEKKRVFKFHEDFFHYEISVKESEVIPRMVKLHQELVQDSDVALYRRVEQFVSVLIISNTPFEFGVVFDKNDLPF